MAHRWSIFGQEIWVKWVHSLGWMEYIFRQLVLSFLWKAHEGLKLVNSWSWRIVGLCCRQRGTRLPSMDALKFCHHNLLICGSDSAGSQAAVVQIWDVDAIKDLLTFPASDSVSPLFHLWGSMGMLISNIVETSTRVAETTRNRT